MTLTNKELEALISGAEDMRAKPQWGSMQQSGEAMSQLLVEHMKVQVELIKTSRELDEKNSKVQGKLLILTAISTFTAFVAVFLSILKLY